MRGLHSDSVDMICVTCRQASRSAQAAETVGRRRKHVQDDHAQRSAPLQLVNHYEQWQVGDDAHHGLLVVVRLAAAARGVELLDGVDVRDRPCDSRIPRRREQQNPTQPWPGACLLLRSALLDEEKRRFHV